MNSVIEQYILDLSAAGGGLITARELVEHARPEDSPIHKFFEWDDTIAAQKYREDQARGYIGRVRIVHRTTRTEYQAVAYVRDPSKPADEQGYVDTKLLRSNEEMAAAALSREVRRALAALDRLEQVARGLNIPVSINRDSLLEILDQLKDKQPCLST